MSTLADQASWHSIPHCLRISEVLQNVLNWVGPIDDQGPDRADAATLASLGRTCRTFFEPAMDLLYRDFHAIERLIMVMPRDLWRLDEETTLRRTIYILRFNRTPNPEDWVRLDFYAKRVRNVAAEPSTVANGTRIVIDDKVWETYAAHRPNVALFPNLRALDFPHRNIPAEYFRLFLSPSVVKLHLRMGSRAALSIACDLAPLVSGIEIMVISGLRFVEEDLVKAWHEAVAKLLQHTPRLHLLQSPAWLMSSSAYTVLTSYTLLRALNMPRWDATFTRLSHCSLPPSPFATLANLFISVMDFASVTSLFSQMAGTPLKIVHLNVEDIAAPSEIRGFFGTLASFHATMLEFHLNYEPHTEDGHNYTFSPYREKNNPATLSTLQPLAKLKNLHWIELSLRTGLALGDGCIAQIATWWPLVLRLALSNSISPTRAITIRGLTPFAQHCDKLRVLTLNVDVDPPACAHEGRPGCGYENVSLVLLDIGDSLPPSDPQDMALFLSDAFPSLGQIEHAFGGQSGVDFEEGVSMDSLAFRWARVEFLLRPLQEARSQERMWKWQKAEA